VGLSRLVIITAVLLIVGVGTILSGFHGNAGFNFGLPVSVTSMTLSVNATGARALVGVLGVVLGAVLFVMTLIVAIVQEFSGPRPSR
jgi:hypothetical protein